MSKQKNSKQNCNDSSKNKKITTSPLIRKMYGSHVNELMRKTGVSWEIGKMVANKQYDAEQTIEICKELANAKHRIETEPQWKKLGAKNKCYAIEQLFVWTCLHNRFNLNNPKIFSILESYLFAD